MRSSVRTWSAICAEVTICDSVSRLTSEAVREPAVAELAAPGPTGVTSTDAVEV